MFYVYILKLKGGALYYGYTSDLKRRFAEHERGKVRSTRKRNPRLIYYEAYIDKDIARIREKNLKTGKGREEIKVRLDL